MSIDQSELDAFNAFMAKQNGDADSLEEAVRRFREYQAELFRLRQHISVSLAESERGEATPLDSDAVKEEVRQRLAQEGIVE